MQSLTGKKYAPRLGFFLLTTFVVSGAAFFNKFPLVQEASGRFLLAGLSLDPPPGETGTYGLFVRMVTWQASLWPIVLVQAAILNALLLRTTALLLPGFKRRRVYFPLVLGLALLTGMSWIAGTLLPDIFLGYAFLGTFLWFLDRELSVAGRIALAVLLVFSWSAQLGHLGFGLVSLLVGGIFWVSRRRRLARDRKNLGLWLGIILLALLWVPTYNALMGNGFRFHSSFRVHLLAKGVENGMLDALIGAECRAKGPGEKDRFCAYCGETAFSAYAVKLDRDSVLQDSTSSAWDDPVGFGVPGHLPQGAGAWLNFLGKGFSGAFRQLLTNDFTRYANIWMDEEQPYAHNIARVVHDRFPHAFGEYMFSRQNRINLRLELLPFLNWPLLGLSLGFLIWQWGAWGKDPKWRLFVGLLLGFIVLNALVQGMLLGVNDLAGARLTWLLVFAAGAMAVKRFGTNVNI
ncbi:MAG: hypothetical protein AAGN35_03580 [Bacteroidota bacterium]